MSESKGQKGVCQCMNCLLLVHKINREFKILNLKRIKRLETFIAM